MRIIFLLILEAKQHPRMKGALNVRKIFQAFLSPLGKDIVCMQIDTTQHTSCLNI